VGVDSVREQEKKPDTREKCLKSRIVPQQPALTVRLSFTVSKGPVYALLGEFELTKMITGRKPRQPSKPTLKAKEHPSSYLSGLICITFWQ